MIIYLTAIWNLGDNFSFSNVKVSFAILVLKTKQKISVTGLMNYLLLKITMHNFSCMTLVHHMALKVSHCSKGKGIWFVWVPTRKKYIYNFLRIHKMKWDHKKQQQQQKIKQLLILHPYHLNEAHGLWNETWKFKKEKHKKERKKPPLSWFPDLRLLFPDWQQSLVTNITNFLSCCSVVFDSKYVYITTCW